MTQPEHERDELALQAWCDGELDAAATAQFEHRLANDPALRRGRDRIIALRRRLRQLAEDEAPRDLAPRIEASLGAPRPRRQRWPLRLMAACLAAGVIAGAGTTGVLERYQARDQAAGVIVGNHIRGLLAPQPFDVASSDRHAVKPWFAARVSESPKVADLAKEGFTLAGGRVDVVGGAPVATIVYKHAAHVVSVTALPEGRTIADTTIAGYHTRSWRDGSLTYVAVSDLPEADVAAFERAFRAEAKQL